MNNDDIKKLVKLRSHSIDFYKTLENPSSSTSLMNTTKTAFFCEQIISSIDDLIKDYVTFDKGDKE